jgi:cytochrome P450 family 6
MVNMDEKIWPNPREFDPMRISKKAREARHPCAFQGFGDGPRKCIGMRFALLDSKVALVELL